MLTRCLTKIGAAGLVGLSSILFGACEKVPLLAPSGSTITLISTTTALSVNRSTSIQAQVIEAAGTPPHSGTHVSFTTTLGRIEPSDVTTDINGRATVNFLAGSENGIATISALSGGATTGTAGALKIAVGAAGVGSVSVIASPPTVSSGGGTTTIAATIFDINSNALVGAPVTFTTTAGTLASGVVSTNDAGIAATTLSTTQQATVTATVGVQSTTSTSTTTTTTTATASGQKSGSVTVNVVSPPALTITVPATVTKGIPATFTFTVAAATATTSPIRNVTVLWGDGGSDSLGALVGAQSVQHRYSQDGSFRITANVLDASGTTTPVSTSVSVIPLARPSIVVTPNPLTAAVGATVTFTIQITAATGTGIQSTTIDFGDGEVRSLGGGSSATLPHIYTTAGTKSIVVTVTDTADQVSSGNAVVIIS